MAELPDGAPPVAPGVLAHLELVVELDMARLQLAKHDGKRHELAHARRRHQRVGILLVEDEIGIDIHENGVLGLGVEDAAGALVAADAGAERPVAARGKHSESHGELDQHIKAQCVHGSLHVGSIGQAPATPPALGPNYRALDPKKQPERA